MFFKISLAGDLGSGKSTVSDILSEKYGAKIISAGLHQRKIATKLGITIEEFNRLMESDRSYDKKLDDMLAAYDALDGNYIFDSRMSWYFVPSATSFYLKVDPLVAAKRVCSADRTDEKFDNCALAMESLAARRESEAKRYLDYYGQDIRDMNNYDHVVDTTFLTPEAVAEVIEKLYFEGK